MFNQREKAFFASFTDFTPDSSKPSISEFCRLAEKKGWEQDSDLFKSFWRACFKSEAPDSGEIKPIVDAPSAENGLPLLEANLRKLNLETKTTTTPKPAAFTPTASIDADGVIIRYFDTFPGFEPDNETPLQAEFNRLAAQQGWTEGTNTYQTEFLRCCTDEFRYYCGDSTSKLESWQNLCIDITGMVPPPVSKNQCKKALEGFHVNIFDYIDCKRQRKSVEPVFTSKKGFKKYTLKKGNVFPKSAAKSNPFLSIMLEKLFSHRR